MKTLEQQLVCHVNALDRYCSKSLNKTVRDFISKHKQPHVEDRYYSLEDVQSHLKIEVIKSVTNKHNKSGFQDVHSPESYIRQIVRNGIKSFIMEQGDYIMGKKEYMDGQKGRMILESECQNHKLGVSIDNMPWIEAKGLLKEAFKGDIRHDAVFYLVQQKYSYEKIAKLMKVSVDYVKRLYSESEDILADFLDLNNYLPRKNKPIVKKSKTVEPLTYKEKKKAYQKAYYLKNKKAV